MVGSYPLLAHLDLRQNHLSGTIPSVSLEMISLGLNYGLSGTIPARASTLTAASGVIDTSGSPANGLGRLGQLSLFALPLLSGTVPSTLSRLASLDLRLCPRLSGSLPPELASVSEIETTWASISGTIPRTLGTRASLSKLDMGYCFLSGTIPATLCVRATLGSRRPPRVDSRRVSTATATSLG